MCWSIRLGMSSISYGLMYFLTEMVNLFDFVNAGVLVDLLFVLDLSLNRLLDRGKLGLFNHDWLFGVSSG